MISMEFREGQYRPVACCDVCRETISQAIDGHALFPKQPTSPNVPVFFVHKRCEARAPDELRARYAWQPIGAFLVYLSRNSGVPWGDVSASDTAARLENH